jgi:hypothetical protein
MEFSAISGQENKFKIDIVLTGIDGRSIPDIFSLDALD